MHILAVGFVYRYEGENRPGPERARTRDGTPETPRRIEAMVCPDLDYLSEQSRKETVDPLLTLHLLVCGQCREEFWFLKMVWRVGGELAADPEEYWEPLDAEVRQWMRWMGGVEAFSPDIDEWE